jgi:hypothetical protein
VRAARAALESPSALPPTTGPSALPAGFPCQGGPQSRRHGYGAAFAKPRGFGFTERVKALAARPIDSAGCSDSFKLLEICRANFNRVPGGGTASSI